MSHWFVYIICASDDSLYTGITTDPLRRWREHASGKAGAKFFRGRTPKQLALLEQLENRSQASKREAALKKLTRVNKLKLISEQAVASRELLSHQGLSDIPLLNPAPGCAP